MFAKGRYKFDCGLWSYLVVYSWWWSGFWFVWSVAFLVAPPYHHATDVALGVCLGWFLCDMLVAIPYQRRVRERLARFRVQFRAAVEKING
jgi:hypothetical protein